MASKPSFERDDLMSNAEAFLEDREPEPTSQHQPKHKRKRFSREPKPEPVRGPQRPEEVSERVWGLAQQWVEVGTETTGQRPPVRLPEFSQRLDKTLRQTKFIRFVLNGPRQLDMLTFEDGMDYANDLVSRMVRLFWDNLEVGTKLGVAQFVFLEDDWDYLLERARTAIQVDWVKKYGRPVTPMKTYNKGENPYHQAMKEYREMEYSRQILANWDDTPPPTQAERDSRRDTLHRFRNRSGMVDRRHSQSEEITPHAEPAPEVP